MSKLQSPPDEIPTIVSRLRSALRKKLGPGRAEELGERIEGCPAAERHQVGPYRLNLDPSEVQLGRYPDW